MSHEVRIRRPSRTDGALLWGLVRAVGTVEINTCYAYLLWARDFARTCRIAEDVAEPVGFVVAYRPPERPEVIFVWQVGVLASHRGCGLARRLLRSLIEAPDLADCRFLEATVAPSNEPSLRLFAGVATELGVPLERSRGFASSDFGSSPHEPEDLIRVGPFGR